jgi:hypothetical protein
MAGRARGQSLGRTSELSLLPTKAIQDLLAKPAPTLKEYIKGDRGVVGGRPDKEIYDFVDYLYKSFDWNNPFKSVDLNALKDKLETALEEAAKARKTLYVDGDPLKSTLLPVYVSYPVKNNTKKGIYLSYSTPEPLGFRFYEYIAWHMINEFVLTYGMNDVDITKFSRNKADYLVRVGKRIKTSKIGAADVSAISQQEFGDENAPDIQQDVINTLKNQNKFGAK